MKRKYIFTAAVLISAVVFSSCKEKQNEDLTTSVNHNGAVETSVTVDHLDSLHDVLVTKHNVWVKGASFKTIEYRDTVPSLGMEHTAAENSNGNTKTVDVKKDYEIFITVK